MHYQEFSVVSRDGHEVRLRETWPEGEEVTAAQHTFIALGAARREAVEPLPDGRFRIGVRLYVRNPRR